MTTRIPHHRNVTRFIVCFCLWMTVAGPAFSRTKEPTGDLSLADAIHLAQKYHPGIQSANLDRCAADGRVAQAGLLPNPDLSVEAANFGGSRDLSGFDAAEYTVQIEQRLELGGKRGKRLRVATLDRQLADFDLDTRRLDIRAETSRRFVALQEAQERLALARESCALAEAFVKAMADRVRAGRVSPIDEEKARILLAQQQTLLDRAQQVLQTARIRLSAMWGSVTPRFERARGDLYELPAVPALSTLTVRLSANPDLSRWATEVEQRKAVLAQEETACLPDVTIGAGVRRFSDIDNTAFVASISTPLPLFDRNQGKIREAAIHVDKAEKQRRAAELEATATLAETYQTFATAHRRSTTLKNDVVPRSKTVFDAVQSGYAQGKYTYLDVLDARRTFFDGQIEYLEALGSMHQALVELERLLGGTLSVSDNQ